MKKLISIIALAACLFARADAKTDFPVELLGDLEDVHLPYAIAFGKKTKTTGGLVKDAATLMSKKTNADKAKRSFFLAVGELLEIVDKDDFTKLFSDFGYSIFATDKHLTYADRTIDITGFYNESGAPTMNDAVSRICNICLGPLGKAQSYLDKILALNWYDDSFALDIEILSIKLLDTDIYIDRGDIAMLAAFGKAAEGALYLLRGLDISLDYPTVINAVDKIVSDVEGGADFVDAFDASPFARLNVRSVSDLQSARAAFASAIEFAGTGDALVRKRTDTNKHLMQYSDGDDSDGSGLAGVVQMLLDNQDDILSFVDQLITPVNISSAVVSDSVLELTYTGGPLSPTVGSVAVNGVKMPYDLTGVTAATEAGTYEMTLVGYGRSTGAKKVTWKIVIPPPGVLGDTGASVQDKGQGEFVVKPSTDTEDVKITIPVGVDAKKVVVEVSPDTKSINPNGATVKIVRQIPKVGPADITKLLDIPAPDASGVIDLTLAVVKDEIVREALDVTKDAVVSMGADGVSITTAKTRPGLVYTLVEGVTFEGMKPGDSKIGDGTAWSPVISVRGGKSGFYTIRVTK